MRDVRGIVTIENRKVSWLTTTRDEPYKSFIRRAVRYRRDGVPLKLLTYVWDRASEKWSEVQASSASRSAGEGPPRSGLFDK